MDPNAKQLIAEKLRSSSSVLVTVSNNPSVDQLASALGLSLMLNALGKHSTSVFSGEIPDTMQFLNASKRFDSTVDGLRDFIISLSKDKADKLRYKVEDEVVKIFITPYKGKISQDDLDFSQGDFNVDVVVALGVAKREELDNAITAHGRILHDAAIVTITAGESGESDLGTVNWHDPTASSIAEMLVSISEALQGNLLDAQMATAFLTGIVAATDRFSNAKTTPKVMTMSAQLMAAGANQQLIASNLNLEHIDDKKPDDGQVNENQSVDLHQDEEDKPKSDEPSLAEIEKEVHAHEDQNKDTSKPETDENKPLEPAPELRPENKVAIEDPAIERLEEEIAGGNQDILRSINQSTDEQHNENPVEPPSLAEKRTFLDGNTQGNQSLVHEDNNQPTSQVAPVNLPQNPSSIAEVKGQGPMDTAGDHPSLGGTFNATSEQAHDDTELEKQSNVNHEILTHTNGGPPPSLPPEDLLDEARRAVQNAVNTNYDPANNPIQSIGSQPMPGGVDGGQIHFEQPQYGPPPIPTAPVPQNAPPMPPSVPTQYPTTAGPPPMPPNSQMPPPPPPPSAPPPNPPVGGPPPNGVGQMYIPPNQVPPQANPYNQPSSQFPYQQ
jgi:hypothetical protein